MADDEKAKLYQQIVSRADEQRIVERMRLHGFWPADKPLPKDPPDEVRERQQVEAELAHLRREHSTVRDPEKALAQERIRRWQESKKRRADRKVQKLQEQVRRREAWKKTRDANIVHTGEGFSAGLQQKNSDAAALQARGLPVANDSPELANLIGIKLSTLRWLTYHRKGATVVHYHRYSISKKTGGLRYISAPKAALRQAQEWVLQNILSRLPVEPQAHGFVLERSVVSNALPHVNKNVVINLDLKDFFPSITFRRVKGLFRQVGYGEHVATVLALLCTEPPRVATELDGKVYHVALGQRVLPQGACTSPAITNLLCRRLDRRLAGLAKRHDFAYTRYADDLTFSGENGKAVGRLLRSVRSILTSEGFAEHPRKTKVMRRASRQEVTGLTVNVRPTVSRKEVRQLRAIIHNVARHGLESQNRSDHPDFEGHLRGRVQFVRMVDPQRGEPLLAALHRALGTSAGDGTANIS